MNEWDTFNETFWTSIEYFYINLNLENISKSDYSHTKKSGILSKLIILGPAMKNACKVTLCYCAMFFCKKIVMFALTFTFLIPVIFILHSDYHDLQH